MILTIVVVTYNCEDILCSTLLSIKDFSNSFKGDLEIVAVDGNSTDGTLDVINRSNLFNVVVSEPDDGIFDAMNKGAEIATGDWVCFMNAGDSFSDFKNIDIATALVNIESSIGVLYGDCNVLFDHKYSLYKKADVKVSKNNIMPFCHQSAFTRTKFVRRFRFDTKLPRVADQKLYLELYLEGIKFKYSSMLFSIVEAEGFSSENLLLTSKEELNLRFDYGLISKWQFRFSYIKMVVLVVVKKIAPSSLKMLKRKVLGV